MTGLTMDLSENNKGAVNVAHLVVSDAQTNHSTLTAGADTGERGSSARDGQSSGDPDILFEHNGDVSSMVIRNGAHVVVGGNLIIGGAPGSTGSIDYNNGGITFGGPTSFNGHYFKADNALNVAPGAATIKSERIDIDGHTVLADSAVGLSGNHSAGYLIHELGGGQVALGDAKLELQGLGKHLLKDELKSLSANVVEEQTTSPIVDGNGYTTGFQKTLVRYTEVAPDQILVQMSIDNYSLDSKLIKQFTIAGYLKRAE
jgi:hypothetical protein